MEQNHGHPQDDANTADHRDDDGHAHGGENFGTLTLFFAGLSALLLVLLILSIAFRNRPTA